MNKNQKILSFLPTGALGIDRMAVGCYKTGAAKLLSSLFLWLTPIPYMWWGTDVAASFLDEKYMFCNGQATAETTQKITKLVTYITGIAAATWAAYKAKQFAGKMMGKVPGMGKIGNAMGSLGKKIPGGDTLGKMGSKMIGAPGKMGSNVMGKAAGLGSKMFRGGGRTSFFWDYIILLAILIFQLKGG